MIQEEGRFFCEGCSKLDPPLSGRSCTVYSLEGQQARIRMGHCPAAWCPQAGDGNRLFMWASWRTDKPKAYKFKKRIGQQKQSRKRKGR